MDSYPEARGQKPFNWNEFLQKESYTQCELLEAVGKASDWVTCAVGNQCSVLPRNAIGRPLDDELGLLGIDFDTCISKMHINSVNYTSDQFINYKSKAIIILKRIESRSSLLISQLNNIQDV